MVIKRPEKRREVSICSLQKSVDFYINVFNLKSRKKIVIAVPNIVFSYCLFCNRVDCTCPCLMTSVLRVILEL